MSYTDKVELRYSLTESEYLSAVRHYFVRGTGLLARLIVFYGLICAGMLLLNVLLDFAFPLWAVLALLVLIGIAVFRAYLVDLPRRYFRSDPKFRSEYYLTFSDAGIKFKTQDVDSSIAWTLYTSVVESKDFYYLVYGKALPSLTILPKRAFRDRKEESAFRQMLHRHVDQTLKLGEGESDYFPVSSQPPDWR